MPADGAGQERGLLEELLDVVLAEMGMLERRLVQGEDVGSGLELGDGYEADGFGTFVSGLDPLCYVS